MIWLVSKLQCETQGEHMRTGQLSCRLCCLRVSGQKYCSWLMRPLWLVTLGYSTQDKILCHFYRPIMHEDVVSFVIVIPCQSVGMPNRVIPVALLCSSPVIFRNGSLMNYKGSFNVAALKDPLRCLSIMTYYNGRTASFYAWFVIIIIYKVLQSKASLCVAEVTASLLSVVLYQPIKHRFLFEAHYSLDQRRHCIHCIHGTECSTKEHLKSLNFITSFSLTVIAVWERWVYLRTSQAVNEGISSDVPCKSSGCPKGIWFLFFSGSSKRSVCHF